MEVEKSVAGYFRVAKARDEMSAPDIYRGQIEDYCKYKRLKLGQVHSDIDSRDVLRRGFHRVRGDPGRCGQLNPNSGGRMTTTVAAQRAKTGR